MSDDDEVFELDAELDLAAQKIRKLKAEIAALKDARRPDPSRLLAALWSISDFVASPDVGEEPYLQIARHATSTARAAIAEYMAVKGGDG